MEILDKKYKKDLIIAGGLIQMVGIAFLIFSRINRSELDDFFIGNPVFFIYYLISAVYFIVVLISNRPLKRIFQMDKRLFAMSLSSFFISSFMLNHSMNLFSQFSVWAEVYVIVVFISFNLFAFIDHMNKAMKYFVLLLTGSSAVFITYLAFYLMPIYGFAILLSFLLGISLHTFAPIMMLASIVTQFINLKKGVLDKVMFFAGIALPVIVVVLFLIRWNNVKEEIHVASIEVLSEESNDLPAWILLCQRVHSDDFSKMIVSGDLVYDSFETMGNRWQGGLFEERKIHDPLVSLGLSLMGEVNLDQNQRIKILKSQYDARHKAQRKLWSGRNIGVVQVYNNVKIYPDYRFAYTEKVIELKNFNSWSGDQQEAAFTFHLPEGSVATSLSLWIDGKEEKSRLTTKKKADSAYVNIVGVQRRDPALLHWQEGNTLTVTVFPCTPKENRTFKIGVTTPLNLEDGILKMKSIYFEGPELTNALETTDLSVVSDFEVENIQYPSGFSHVENNKYRYTGNCRAYWETSCKPTLLQNNTFSFNKKSYKMEPIVPTYQNVNIEKVFLDINTSWTKREYQEVLNINRKKEVYAYTNKVELITELNKDELFEQLQHQSFSLFPFHVVGDRNTSIVISKSPEISPNLGDVKNTKFYDKLLSSLTQNKQHINLYQLGYTTSPYLKTLKEFQVFNFEKGDINNLERLMSQGRFIVSNADKDIVDIDIAGVKIIRSQGEQKASTAPDHILRLFAYNNIMKQLDIGFLSDKSVIPEKLIEEANEGYIVSPISSLIVLETQKDYDRFKIGENKNSLKNASMNSSGSVPEPEEWVLIILFLFILSYLTLKRIGKVSPVLIKNKNQ